MSPHENRIAELMIQKISPKLIACFVSTSSKGSGTASTAQRMGSGREAERRNCCCWKGTKPQKVQCTGPGERGQAALRDPGLLPYSDGGKVLLWQTIFLIKCRSNWHGTEQPVFVEEECSARETSG